MALPPGVTEWVEQYDQPDVLEQIRAAMAADRAAQKQADAAATVQQGVDMFVQRKPNVAAPAVKPVDDNMKAWLLARQAGQQDAKLDLERQKADREFQSQFAPGRDLLNKIRAEEAQQNAGPVPESVAARFRELGYDPTGLNRGEALQLLPKLEDRKSRADQAAQSAQDRASARADAASARADAKAFREQQASDAKAARDALATNRQKDIESKGAMGPDFEPLDNSSPLYADEAGKRAFLSTATSARKLSRDVEEVRAIVQKHGTNPLAVPAEQMTRINSLVADMRTQIKNIDQLGVVAGPDLPMFIAPQIDNPAQFSTWFREKFWKYNPLAQLDQLEKNMKGGVAEAATGYGVKIRPEGAFGAHIPGGGKKRIKVDADGNIIGQ